MRARFARCAEPQLAACGARLPAPGKTGTAARYGKMPEAPPDDEGQKHKKMAQELAKSVLENRARSEEQQKEFDAAFKDF